MAQVAIASDRQEQSLTRRTFLQRTLAGGASTALLGGCAWPTQTNVATTLNWICEGGANGDITSFQMLAQMYNALNKDQITVNVHPGTAHDLLKQMFTDPVPANRVQYDIVSADVVWVSEFASKGWIIPLDDRYWPKDKTKQYLSIPLQAASYRGKLYGAPLHSDVGVLYYRTDFSDIIQPENIKSLDDLARMALEAQQQKKIPSGFTWQALPFNTSGKVYEGLICNFVEILSGYGGQIFDNPHKPSKVLINSSEARNALDKMSSWTKTISPGVTENKESGSTNEWIRGQAAFMRNWPAAVVESSDHLASSIADQFNITSLLGGGCLGGWQLAINSNSPPQKQDKAWDFIWWMLQHDAQHYLAIKENFPVTLAEIYADDQIKQQNKYYRYIQDYINKAQSRPSIPNYQDFTKAIATMINNVFAGAKPEDVLPVLEEQLQKLIPSKSRS